MRNISNSEVTTWLSCRQQYDFAHYRNLEPVRMGVPLYRGNIGHEAFQRYAEARISGASHERSLEAGRQVFVTAMKATGNDYLETIMQTRILWDKYMAFHNGWPEFRILGTEDRYDLKLTDDMVMTIRYDIMVEEIKTSRVLIGDFKFTYDFWTVDEHNLNGQMPKYIACMNANGIKVDGGFLEEIRTRPLGKEKAADPKYCWRRTKYFPSNAKKINVMRQHIAAAIEITEYRNLSDADREAKTIPVLNKNGACKYCNFAEVCASKLDGGDFEYMLKTQFQPNTYGYNNGSTEQELM